MTRRACTFRKADVKRAIQATAEAGAQISRIEIDRAGKIVIFTGAEQRTPERDAELDAELAEHQTRHAQA